MLKEMNDQIQREMDSAYIYLLFEANQALNLRLQN